LLFGCNMLTLTKRRAGYSVESVAGLRCLHLAELAILAG
jgi:hypothetical protein